MNVLVTGSAGFVGRNLCTVLRARDGLRVFEFDVAGFGQPLEEGLSAADIVYHLAGVNRPDDPADFQRGNAGSVVEICRKLEGAGRAPKIVLASSIQVELDNPYGRSKRAAEDTLRAFCGRAGSTGVVYRFKNLFGKWCRPNYNSVTATFCHNIAHGLPVRISDPATELDLTYIDDAVAALVGELGSPESGYRLAPPLLSFRTTLGDLAALIRSFRGHRATLLLPDFAEPFVRALYATYLSYLPAGEAAYALDVRSDPRGSLAEFIKSPGLGQIFVSRTLPGVTRGNHYHHTKAEKFLVVAGEAAIRLRPVRGGEVVEFRVRGEDYRVVDIPPGYTHSIENVGTTELVTLFWASEMFDQARPDTIAQAVLRKEGAAE